MSSPQPVELEVEVDVDESMEVVGSEMLPADRFELPARAEEVVELWRAKMAEGLLTPQHFLEYWRVTVPKLYSPQPNRTCLDWTFDEELGTKLLIHTIEQFILGSTDGALPTKRRSTLCGRVFKPGEPAYSCRECGVDNTCVLCVECFKVSAHKNHKYKMCRSGGGGCCDCGDTEAWRRDPFCQLHAATDDSGQADTTTSPEVIERLKIVTNVGLRYAFKVLTHDHAPGVPNDVEFDFRLKPADNDPLRILDEPDCYCTLLYNDEVHTFEQVISTLTRITKCNHRDAVELVSLIDREGRALVKCNSFQVCDKLKGDIEIFTTRNGGSLKVSVNHVHLIAHQHFALKFIQWLQSFVSQEPSLRLAAGLVYIGEEVWPPKIETVPPELKPEVGGGVCLLVMQNDCRMWKAARTAWHRLLIATCLMDYTTKKALAWLFTKNYGTMLKDFIRDDHDHSFSITSLSVQLYAATTLAHWLIAKQDAMYIVLNTFLSECQRCCNKKGRLEFDRNRVSAHFERAQFVLYDVKYLLTSVPTVFEDDLRKGFLHGLSLMAALFVMMQGMDSVVRQVGQHTEYEPEWEGAFNLHVKFDHSISLALEWCAADRTLAANAYLMMLRKLFETETFPDKVVKELGNKSASVIPYDVSTEPVSIHRPLSRFTAGLFLCVHKHGFSYHSRDLARTEKPIPPPEDLIEPVLRTMAMIAQVHAGMWRRNGFALLNQLYFYHNVKCRSEMLDRDVIMLQVGASLIESNEFIIHVLNKFNLLDWATSDFEQRGIEDDSLRHVISLVEEFLGLLITIYGSRYVPGVGEVTPEDKTKKEIIQMLCVKPMAHSELNRSLPEDQLHETGLEAVIHEVADFSKPPGSNNRGMYTLKAHLYDEYDTFFYHYTKEDLSRSEEAQRNRRKAAGLPECCPPPALPKLTQQFRLIANLLQSESALLVLKTVFERALDLRARSFSESQVHKALHLMGYALRDEESGHYEFLAFAECAQRAGIYDLLQQIAASARVDAHKALALWLIAKMKKLLGIKDEAAGDAQAMETDQQEAGGDDAADAEKLRRAKLAAERRAKLMAQMQAAQNNFISNNATLFETTTTEVTAEEEEIRPLYSGAALGVWGGGVPELPRVCIMCQEEARVDAKSEPMVLVAFVQYSTVLSRRRFGDEIENTDDPTACFPIGVGPQPHVSSCGHALHASCCRKYVDSVIDKENRRPYRLRQPAAFDVEKREYLCPLCERLCNTALPLIPSPPTHSGAPPPLTEETFTDSVNLIMKHQVCYETVHHCTESCEEMHCTARARSVGAMSSDMETGDGDSFDSTPVYVTTHCRDLLPADFLAHFDGDSAEYNGEFKQLIIDFMTLLPLICNQNEVAGLPSCAAFYRATSYSIMSVDSILRAENRPLLGDLPARHKDALQALIRIGAVLPCLYPTPKHLGHHALSVLNTLEKTSPVTQISFSILVPLVLSAPALLSKATGPSRPTHLARQILLEVFRSNVIRALIVTDVSGCTVDSMDSDDYKITKPDLENLLPMMKEIRKDLNIEELCANEVWECIKKQCHAFLRQSCLLFHFLSDIIPPNELLVVGGDTWDIMCGYLDVPSTFRQLIDTPLARSKVKQWVELSEEWFNGGIEPRLVLEPCGPPKLISLPEDFSELMNIVSEFSCPNSERDDSKYPTMCLVCGQILCSQSYCCQREIRKTARGTTEHAGAAMWHSASCGAGSGLFLRVRECETLLLASPARGAMLAAPYLDLYGETDQGLRRGNPLHLCPNRYEQLRMLWLSHGLYERIARSLDSNMLIGSMQWQNM